MSTPKTDAEAGWVSIDGDFRRDRQYSPCGTELTIRNYVRAEFASRLEESESALLAALKESQELLASLLHCDTELSSDIEEQCRVNRAALAQARPEEAAGDGH